VSLLPVRRITLFVVATKKDGRCGINEETKWKKKKKKKVLPVLLCVCAAVCCLCIASFTFSR
jgi:hypothetical protein